MCMYIIYKDQQPLVLMLCVNPGPQARQARALSGSHDLGPLSCFFLLVMIPASIVTRCRLAKHLHYLIKSPW